MKKIIALLLLAVMLFSGSPAYAWWGYHHPRGYHYYAGRWWLGDAVVAGLVAGAVVASLPPYARTVYVGGVPYYYDGMYYYQSGPAGYVVVQPSVAPVVVAPPAVPVVAAPVVAAPVAPASPAGPAAVVQAQASATVAVPAVVQNAGVTVKIKNKNGSETEIMLVRKGKGFVGPQGEYYEVMPSKEQLNALYGAQ